MKCKYYIFYSIIFCQLLVANIAFSQDLLTSKEYDLNFSGWIEDEYFNVIGLEKDFYGSRQSLKSTAPGHIDKYLYRKTGSRPIGSRTPKIKSVKTPDRNLIFYIKNLFGIISLVGGFIGVNIFVFYGVAIYRISKRKFIFVLSVALLGSLGSIYYINTSSKSEICFDNGSKCKYKIQIDGKEYTIGAESFFYTEVHVGKRPVKLVSSCSDSIETKILLVPKLKGKKDTLFYNIRAINSYRIEDSKYTVIPR